MSYVPGCSADVFISYAHRDNQDGWVSRLKARLTEKLNPFLAGRAEVYFDDRIRPGVYFQNEIREKLQNTPIFVAIISPSFLDSDYCMIEELEWFQDHSGKDIIQLLKVPLEAGQQVPLPQAAYKILHHESDGHVFEGEALEAALDGVVAAMMKRLREFWEVRPKIYLAQIRNEELKPRWDQLKQALHAEGYALLPKGVLPGRVPDTRIREWLEGARLSLHLSGTSDDALAQRQLEIARQTGKPVLILDAPPQAGEVAAVVARVQEQLEANRNPAVYFIVDYYSDGPRVSGLTELIRLKTGCDVYLPEAGEKYHKFRLQVSDGLLLFRGEAPEDWLESQEQALLQAAARRDRRLVAEAKYITRRPNGRPVGVTATQGRRQEWIIERVGEPNLDDLQPFLEALLARVKAAAGGTG